MHEIYTLSFSTGRTTRQQWRHRGHPEPRYSSQIGISYGAIHLILGFLSVILGIVGLVSEFHASKFGSALWSGLIFEATGACGIIASRRWYRGSYVRCFCVTSVMSAFVALLLFALTCVGIANHYARWSATYGINIISYTANVSANVIVLATVEMVVSLTSATMSAKAIRWRNMTSMMAPPRDKNSIVIRETFVVPRSGESQASTTVPDVVRSAPGTLAAIHRMATEGALHLQMALPSDYNYSNVNHDSSHSYESLDIYHIHNDESDPNGQLKGLKK